METRKKAYEKQIDVSNYSSPAALNQSLNTSARGFRERERRSVESVIDNTITTPCCVKHIALPK
jgi:cystathionine beta-lyase/cystathionine gamma-synthase